MTMRSRITLTTFIALQSLMIGGAAADASNFLMIYSNTTIHIVEDPKPRLRGRTQADSFLQNDTRSSRKEGRIKNSFRTKTICMRLDNGRQSPTESYTLKIPTEASEWILEKDHIAGGATVGPCDDEEVTEIQQKQQLTTKVYCKKFCGKKKIQWEVVMEGVNLLSRWITANGATEGKCVFDPFVGPSTPIRLEVV